MPRPRIWFVLNTLRPGTGPFQRAFRLDPERFETTVVSCYDTTEELTEMARSLVPDLSGVALLGVGQSNRFRCLVALDRHLGLARPDLVQTNHTFSAVALGFLCRRRRIPLVHFEGTLLSAVSRGDRTLLRAALPRTAATICVSRSVAEVNARYRPDPRRLVIYNGVDVEEVIRGASGQPRAKDGRITIGFVGDLRPVKDIGTLVHGFALVARKFPEAHLLLVGGGALEDRLLELAESLGVRERVECTGAVSRSQVYRALGRMDVFVLPSLVEGLSEALAQALACGVPVLVSDIPSNTEVISDDRNGRTFRVGDPQDLANTLERMCRDPALRARLGSHGCEFARKRLDIFKIVRDYGDLYEEVLCR